MARGGGHEDEYEYEYDDNDTEELYFTLDLTTHVPGALIRKTCQPEEALHPTLSGSVAVEQPLHTDEPAFDARLQLVDLHTEQPLLRFGHHLYDCYWSTDLGTQFHICEAGAVEKPRRPGAILDVVATSQTRLVGKPVAFTKPIVRSANQIPTKRAREVGDAAGGVHDESGSEDEGDERNDRDELQAAPGQQLHIPRSFCKDQVAEAQATFLERLSEIKLKKGERDIVPVHSVRVYETPANSADLRRDALAADAEKAKQARHDQLVAVGQRTQNRRRRLTHAEKGIAPRTDVPVDAEMDD